MARYIECEAACAEVDKGDLLIGNNAEFAKEIINRTPAADVVPKSVADVLHHLLKDAWKRIEELDNLCGKLQKAKDEFAREIFAEIEKLSHKFMNDEHYIFGDMVWDITELKKKYTKSEQKSCENCTYYDDYREDQPCYSCNDCSNWKREEKEQ